MIRHTFALAAFLAAVPVAAQSQQDALQTRYDRALAAGYKALMLCGALASAERSGAERSEASVLALELTGIQQPLAGIVGELNYRVERQADGRGPIRHVAVDWADDMPPRLASYRNEGGCALMPIGAEPDETLAAPAANGEVPLFNWSMKITSPARAVLDAALAGGYGEGSRTTAVSVDWGENEWDWRFADGFAPNTPQRTWSVAKSIAATLIGAAVQRGEAPLVIAPGAEQPTMSALDWYHETADPREAITLDHLLRMASGRYSDTPGNRTDALYFGGSTVRETALHWPVVHAPGTVFRYANNDTLAAVMAISYTFVPHPPSGLFASIGMEDSVAETDWRGDYVLSSQVWTSTRDLAKLGQLYLDDGVLPDGTRILPENWVKYVSTPSGPQPEGEFGYGAGFWLLNKSDGVPPDTFAAFGNRGQYVVIVPSRKVVIVRRGEDPVGSRFDIAAFTRDVLAALDQ